jgi:hypothetical protein
MEHVVDETCVHACSPCIDALCFLALVRPAAAQRAPDRSAGES